MIPRLLHALADDHEARRITALSACAGAAPIAALTDLLARPGGQQTLRPAQAQALTDLLACGGLVAPMPVGSGKTLVTLLAATLTQAERPVLLVPAALIERTRSISYPEYSVHWRCRLPRLIGYEYLSAEAQHDELEEYAPDLLIADEAHYLRSMRSSRTRRVARWRLAHQDAAFVALSGTLLDFRASHLCAWALAERSPLPWPDATNRFIRAVDELEAKPGMRAMVKLTRSVEIAASPDGRNALPPDYLDWCLEREGVVGAKGDHDCPASLTLTRWSPPEPEAIRDAIRHVEETGTRLDREPLSPAMQTSQCQQLSQGFYYVEDPLPPLEWLEIRRDWSRFARRQAETGRYDSEGEIKRAFPEIYEPWRQAQQTYRATNVARWIDDAPLRAAIDWAHTGDPAIVWVGHRAAGRRLADLGLPYYGELAVDASTGQHIEHARGPIAASIKACGTGTNLQAYRRALVLLPPSSEILFEQLIGRLHRSGQIADEVEIAVIKVRSHRHFERPLAKAIAVAKYKGPTRKLALAA